MDVTRFNPHAMSDAQVRLLSTGRDRLIDAVIETLIAAGEPRQHVLVSAPRGFGKSFFARAVALTARDRNVPARVVILPEEQRNVSTPSGFLREIGRALEGRPASSVTGQFLDDPPGAWEEASEELAAIIEAAEGGTLIVVVENFDDLVDTVFSDPIDQSRLRALLAESRRLGFLATAVSADVDRDYEQRLFHAFAKFQLEPWSADDHILYFERRAILDGRDDFTLDVAKVRALASFTGGAPRMAVALANLLLESDPLSAAELLDKLVDDLTPYYQALIDQMPTRTKTLFDALVRQGEPCSQSDLAIRVGTVQNRIAQNFAWLRERGLVAGKRRTGGRDFLYQVADRLFVQYYRKRYLLHDSYTPLAGMAELLDGFFSADENRLQAIRLLEAGRSEEASEFCRAFLATDPSDLGNWARQSDNREALAGITAELAGNHDTALAHFGRALLIADAAGDKRGAALLRGQIGILALRLRMIPQAIEAHQVALVYWTEVGERKHIAWTLSQLAQDYRRAMQFTEALDHARQALAILGAEGAPDRIASLWGQIGENLRRLGRTQEAVDAFLEAEARWTSLGNKEALAWTIGGLGLAYCQQGSHRHAVATHRRAIEIFSALGGRSANVALNLGWLAAAAREQNHFDEAVEADREALELWQTLGDHGQQSRSFQALGHDLEGRGDVAEAVTTMERGLEHALSCGAQTHYISIAGHLAELHVRSGHASRIWNLLDDAAVDDLRTLCELILAHAGRALVTLANLHGRAAGYAAGQEIIDALAARADQRYLADGVTFLLGGVLEAAGPPALLSDLIDASVRLPHGLSGVRQIAFELAAEVIGAADRESLIEQADPDVADAVRTILASIAERQRRLAAG